MRGLTTASDQDVCFGWIPTCTQPDGALFVYALGEPTPAWVAAAQHYQWVLVLHGPELGLRDSSGGQNTLDEHAGRAELAAASKDGLVTGGLMRWGRVRPD